MQRFDVRNSYKSLSSLSDTVTKQLGSSNYKLSWFFLICPSAGGAAEPSAEREKWPAVQSGGGPGGPQWANEETQSCCGPGPLWTNCLDCATGIIIDLKNTLPLSLCNFILEIILFENVKSSGSTSWFNEALQAGWNFHKFPFLLVRGLLFPALIWNIIAGLGIFPPSVCHLNIVILLVWLCILWPKR